MFKILSKNFSKPFLTTKNFSTSQVFIKPHYENNFTTKNQENESNGSKCNQTKYSSTTNLKFIGCLTLATLALSQKLDQNANFGCGNSRPQNVDESNQIESDKPKKILKSGNENKYLLISGPSGVGKGTLIRELVKKYGDHIGFSVSYTTRKARPGEEHAKDYFFVDEETFVEGIDKGDFVEHVHFADKRYGTNRNFIEEIIKNKKVCLLDVEVNGAKMIKDSGYKGVLLFIKPPTFEDLEKRLIGRGTEAQDVIDKRVNQARVDLEKVEADNFFTYSIVNDKVDKASQELIDIFEKEFME